MLRASSALAVSHINIDAEHPARASIAVVRNEFAGLDPPHLTVPNNSLLRRVISPLLTIGLALITPTACDLPRARPPDAGQKPARSGPQAGQKTATPGSARRRRPNRPARKYSIPVPTAS